MNPRLQALPDDPQTVVLEKMALRCEHYAATGERPLPKAPRMCATCPFLGANSDYRKECALIPAQDWPCHTDESEHCAGHHAAQAIFGKPTPDAIRAAIADTNPKDGDVQQAPLVSGGGSEGNRP